MGKLIAFVYCFVLLSCHSDITGTLIVHSSLSGTFQLFKSRERIDGQVLSEDIGTYNQPLSLEAGFYRIIAECSQKEIEIKSGVTTDVSSVILEFRSSAELKADSFFQVKCELHDERAIPQTYEGKFKFVIIQEQVDLLVGLKTLSLSFDLNDNKKEHIVTLGTVTVNEFKLPNYEQGEVHPDSGFFLSNLDTQIPVTQKIPFSKNLFLLPGRYELSLNGSKQTIELKQNEQIGVELGALIFLPPQGMETLPSSYTFLYDLREPITVELNREFNLDLNQVYFVFPSELSYQLPDSTLHSVINVQSHEFKKIQTKGVFVESICSPWEWECLGRRKIQIFQKNARYPFIEAQSDKLILFDQNDITVGIEGSEGLYYRIINDTALTKLNLGRIVFVPQISYRPGNITDLVRVEPMDSHKLLGYSKDVPFDLSSTFYLISGSYSLKRFVSLSGPEGKRLSFSQTLEVQAGKTLEVEVPFFLPEKKAKVLSEKIKDGRGKLFHKVLDYKVEAIERF